MESARRRAAFWLVVPLLASVAAVGVASPASAQSTLRQAAADDYLVGAAVTPSLLSNPTYANIVRTEFSSVTAENHMKWDTIEPSQGNFNFGPADQVVQFAQQNDMHIYGHTLVWHSQTPSWVQQLSGSALDQAMENHITTLVNRYEDDVERWDVVNEVIGDSGGQLRNSFWLQGLGPDYIANAFRYADAADPDATLCMNDYSIDGMNTKSNAYFNLVQDLLAQGVPIDCMGFQAHLILGQVPGDMRQNLQRFANLGLEIWVTELDIRIPEPVSAQELQQQATEFARVFEICQNLCAGVTVWGVHDAQSWVDSTFPEFDAPLLWDDNLNPKPAYSAVLEQLGGDGGNNQNPPPAPTGLTATNVTSNSVSLSWNASSGATSYQVQRASGGGFATVGTTSGTSFTNSGLSANTTYQFRVTASNNAGTSAPSNTVTVTTDDGGGGGGGGDCEVSYQASNWGNHPGFTASVIVTNTGGSTINGWDVQWSYPAGQTISPPGWNATVSQSGSTVTATNAPWNGTLAPNQSASFGFNGTAASIGNNPEPTSFTLNGTSCSVS